jgi:hypothetical protein
MEAISAFLMEMSQKYPQIVAVFLAIGVLRAIFKPIMSVAEAFVAATPNKEDDLLLDGFKKGKFYSSIIWFLDFFASIKVK